MTCFASVCVGWCRSGLVFLLLAHAGILVYPAQNSLGASEEKVAYSRFVPSFQYGLDLRLVWLDRLARPLKGEGEPPLTWTGMNQSPGGRLVQVQGGGPRSLGLKSLRADLRWHLAEESSLELTLRPDAPLKKADGAEASHDFDARAGLETGDRRPPLKLLDSYRVSRHWGHDLEFAVGVWESLASPYRAYDELLSFGLSLPLPTHFLGLRMRWRQALEPTAAAVAAMPRFRGFTYDLYVWQGDEDRLEKSVPSDVSFDAAPAAADPYTGTALAVQWSLADAWQASGLIAYYKEARAGAVVQRTQGDFGLGWDEPELLSWPLLVRANLRWSDEQFPAGSGLGASPALASKSLALTGRLSLAPSWDLVAGAYWGHRESLFASGDSRPVARDGYQWELGGEHHFAGAWQTRFLVAEEHRRRTDAEGFSGGGFRSPGREAARLRRFALEIHYTLSSRS